jgi:hypothetical protein
VQARRLAPERGVPLKIVRPGPLVDYEQFKAPGRLGRELGPLFLAVGPKRGGLAVCDVGTAARVLAYYVEHFDEAPELLNLVEPETADRRALVERLRAQRPELGVLWMPAPVLKMLSVAAKLAFRVMGRQPMDVYAAFAGERYDTAVAAKVVAAAGR